MKVYYKSDKPSKNYYKNTLCYKYKVCLTFSKLTGTGSWWYTQERFAVKHPHEYITVDELNCYRKRKFSQDHAST